MVDERLSIIIPALNEAPRLEGIVEQVRRLPGPTQIIVADGGSDDGTEQLLERFPEVELVRGPLGRGSQQNAGAARARGSLLWFLHADSVVPEGAATLIRRTLADPGLAGGAFRFALDAPGWKYRVIEFGVYLRAEWLGRPYGDQGYFLRRSLFEQLGGFPEQPWLEDLHFLKRWKQAGPVVVLPVKLRTSARRWRAHGALSTTLRNWSIAILDALGVSFETLDRWFGTRKKSTDGTDADVPASPDAGRNEDPLDSHARS